MPKYRYAVPYDIIRDIKQLKQGFKDLVIQLQQNGISLQTGIVGNTPGPGDSGNPGSGGGGIGGNVMPFEPIAPESVVAMSVPDSIDADLNLTDNQKAALQALYESYLRSNGVNS
jgi:hypothetical protein